MVTVKVLPAKQKLLDIEVTVNELVYQRLEERWYLITDQASYSILGREQNLLDELLNKEKEIEELKAQPTKSRDMYWCYTCTDWVSDGHKRSFPTHNIK